jgi:hypothetical protein
VAASPRKACEGWQAGCIGIYNDLADLLARYDLLPLICDGAAG